MSAPAPRRRSHFYWSPADYQSMPCTARSSSYSDDRPDLPARCSAPTGSSESATLSRTDASRWLRCVAGCLGSPLPLTRGLPRHCPGSISDRPLLVASTGKYRYSNGGPGSTSRYSREAPSCAIDSVLLASFLMVAAGNSCSSCQRRGACCQIFEQKSCKPSQRQPPNSP